MEKAVNSQNFEFLLSFFLKVNFFVTPKPDFYVYNVLEEDTHLEYI